MEFANVQGLTKQFVNQDDHFDFTFVYVIEKNKCQNILEKLSFLNFNFVR